MYSPERWDQNFSDWFGTGHHQFQCFLFLFLLYPAFSVPVSFSKQQLGQLGELTTEQRGSDDGCVWLFFSPFTVSTLSLPTVAGRFPSVVYAISNIFMLKGALSFCSSRQKCTVCLKLRSLIVSWRCTHSS